MDITKASDRELMDELESRGYKTELLFCLLDVANQLNSLNKERADDDLPPVVMDEGDMGDILDKINFDWLISRANDNISEAISEFADEFDQLNNN